MAIGITFSYCVSFGEEASMFPLGVVVSQSSKVLGSDWSEGTLGSGTYHATPPRVFLTTTFFPTLKGSETPGALRSGL